MEAIHAQKMENFEEEADSFKHETVHLSEEGTSLSNREESCACVVSCRYSRNRFRTDISYQDKVIYSACLLFTVFIIGWAKGQFGPAYIDLRMISGTDLKEGSWILTSLFIGYSIGSTLQGFLYNRVNRKLMFSTCLFIWSATIAAIPWCSLFEAMLTGYSLVGVLQGVLDTGAMTEILRVWEKKGRIAILTMNLLFASGSVVSPLVVAPFLMDPQQDNKASTGPSNTALTTNLSYSETEMVTSWHNRSKYNFTSTDRNISDQHVNENFKYESEIYIPFSIIAGLSLLCCVMFFMSYVMFSKGHERKKEGKIKKVRKLSLEIKIVSIATISGILFFYCAIDEAYTSFLTTYCVEYFHWSKQKGAVLTSVVFIFILVARLLIVIFERWVNTLVFIGVNLILMFISILGLLLISLYHISEAAWFFSPLFGFSKSCLFALLLSWSNEYIVPMTGRLSSCYFVISTLGCALNPVLLGVLMENQPIWFCYLFLVEIVIVLVLYVLGILATKYIQRNYGYTYDAEPDVVKACTGYSEKEEMLANDTAIQS